MRLCAAACRCRSACIKTISRGLGTSSSHISFNADAATVMHRRKTKLLLGMLRGKWGVGLDWVHACIKAGEGVSEADHEVLQCSTRHENAHKPGTGLTKGKGTYSLGDVQVQQDIHGQLGTMLGRLQVGEGQTLLHGYEVCHYY